ncbi:putative mitogen-activated protein kinase kinase kinase STE-STE11 family [Helianthus annuus]|uniref:Mitogen-activated protein kinase kinase kinase STE-STE11 family n=1 Tax=Helianthus annuus TaxID=4232 RepID=A0A251RX29_HELAN|nr:putative mitogen-activated protein kinase kinase kinase STE-STE11 family [Helianthus annuus]KAJ0458726.1 putative mitogen-activated protein kinase kinase kinase STE-STE11 family [Helianthus annuus]KAJ0639269.1 putative mitogen-activated protein kinase kinase kinase STE-STE11 family [Helianthus annuus]
MNMNLQELNTMKRRLFGGDKDHEGKRSKQEDWTKHAQKMYGDGAAWVRGVMIGKGSFGYVFIANLKNDKSRYSLYPPVMAVKSAEVSASGSIQKEKEVMDNINGCPYVIKCFGEEITNGESGRMVYNMLLEYGSGGTLADAIKSSNGKGLPELDVRRHARSILRGLSHIHKRGYVHCDLKPQNVLLVANEGKTGGFVAKIGDLGSAKKMKQMKKNKMNNYGPCWRGTPMYLSPEALVNGVQEQPADVWAVGCIVFEMLTGKPLWYSNQDLGVNEMISDGRDLFSGSSSLSAEGRSFLEKCLCRKVMCRLTANMLLKHPFLKGLHDDDIDEIEESHEVFDINTITSSSWFSDDDELWLSSCSEDEDVDVTANGESINARFHEVRRFPVRL